MAEYTVNDYRRAHGYPPQIVVDDWRDMPPTPTDRFHEADEPWWMPLACAIPAGLILAAAVIWNVVD